MSIVQQAKSETINYKRLDTTFGDTVSRLLTGAGRRVDELPVIITIDMRWAIPIRNADAYTTPGHIKNGPHAA